MAVERVLGTENDPDIIETGSEIEVVPDKTREEELLEAASIVVSGDDIFTEEIRPFVKDFNPIFKVS